MKKIVITGFSGFVARYFLEYLYNNHLDYEVFGFSRSAPDYDYHKYTDRIQIHFHQLDLMNSEQLNLLLTDIVPDYCLHLASFSSVAYSWKNPEESFTNNSNIFLNVVDAIRNSNPNCRLLSVGSSEEYGNVLHSELPIREVQALNPLSPYAVARVSQELLSKVYVDAYGLQIIMTRSFNHIGPRQDERFVIPSFVKRIVSIKNQGMKAGEIETGNLEIVRDFVDVRDVVDAYYKLLLDGTVGEVYNICSGNGTKLSEIVKIIADEVGVKVSTRINPAYIRPNDNMEIVGSPYKIQTELGWKCTKNLHETIRDMIICLENQQGA